MKKLLLLVVGAGTALYVSAQTLPKPSPSSDLEQTIGATEIEVEYSRPSAKDRVVFGELVPYDKLWRFGANSATQFSTDHSLFFDGKELKAGEYSVFAIPGKESWEIIFNTDKNAGAEEYNKEKDALRVKAKVQENQYTETFTLGFDKLRDESASFVVLWEKVKVEAPFTLKTSDNSTANIKNAIEKGEDLDKVYNNAANYYYGSLKDYKTALEYVEKSVKMEQNYGNLFLKARILYELGEKEKAMSLATEALVFAEKNASKGYVNFISGTIERWSK